MRRKAQLGKFSKMLTRTGAMPALVYGHQVLGVAPAALLALRRQASKAIAGKGFGRCLTTTLGLTMGSEDPGLALPRQLLSEWLQFWRRHPEYRQRVQRAWRLLHATLKALPQRRR